MCRNNVKYLPIAINLSHKTWDIYLFFKMLWQQYISAVEVVFVYYETAAGLWFVKHHLCLCSVACVVVFVYSPLSPHTSAGWYLRWGHMALMCWYDWVWRALIFY